MATVSISPTDVANAASFLESYLSNQDPSGDYSKGTALRDHTVGALAAIFAFLRAETTQVRQLQSLNTVAEATAGDAQALSDAVTAILSNLLITPGGGSLARGIGIGHASRQTDLFIHPTQRFTRDAGLVFVVDSTDTFFIPATDLVPVFDAANTIVEYQFRVPLVAVRTGNVYNIDPGTFAGFDSFNPFVTRIENLDKFIGGEPPETVDQILARAPTAISVRNLINQRSITATLDDNFAAINGIFIAGMGDPEMQRDVVRLSTALAVHVGGATDIYPLMAPVETTALGPVGGFFPRPDGLVTMFRDPARGTFPGTVLPGDVLRVDSGLPNAPRDFKILANNGTALVISDKAPFPLATDELSPPGAVSYTIGRIAPSFVDLLSGIGGAPFTTGVTSRRIHATGRITLPGAPVMEILDVAIINPQSSEAAYASPEDGFVHFPRRTNSTPVEIVSPTDGLQYQTIIHNPEAAQSSSMWMEVVVGTVAIPNRFDGYILRVRYRTLAGFASVDEFVTSRGERTVAASQLVRAHNPVAVRMVIHYKLKSNALTLLDNSVIAQTAIDFINSFDTSVTPLDTSAISSAIKVAYPTIAAVIPLVIDYDLLAPTGDLLTYETTGQVTVEPDKQVFGPVIDLVSLGVTSRTLRYLSSTADITAVQEP